jgi:hypothetical protein
MYIEPPYKLYITLSCYKVKYNLYFDHFKIIKIEEKINTYRVLGLVVPVDGIINVDAASAIITKSFLAILPQLNFYSFRIL